jgi:hypothetical protein
MKTKIIIIIAVALCAAARAAVVNQSTNAPAHANIKTKMLHLANPFTPAKAEDKSKIERYGGMSSRPWTQIVGWHPGEPAAFTDGKTHVAELPLLWIGAKPQR